MDNGTMVEAFKHLNYCQLAKNSLVSNRFRNLIRTHRHTLALLYVDAIGIDSFQHILPAITIFGKELSPKSYNEWIVSNSYSKQIAIESQAAGGEITQSIINDSKRRIWGDRMTVLSARVKLNHENWPVFQHFIRLATDLFIYIDCMELIYQNEILNLLDETINSDHDRLQCKKLNIYLNNKSQKFITWTKNHVCCIKLYIYAKAELSQNEALLDFFVTGGHCTSSLYIGYCDLSKVVTDFVQKFINLKNSNESQLVEAIDVHIGAESVELLKRDYAKYTVKEERNDDDSSGPVFEFVNNDIRKKLKLIAETYESRMPNF